MPGDDGWLIDIPQENEGRPQPSETRPQQRDELFDPFEPSQPSASNPFEDNLMHELDDLDEHGRAALADADDGWTSRMNPFGSSYKHMNQETPGALPETPESQKPREFDLRGWWGRLRGGRREKTHQGPRLIYLNDPAEQRVFRGNHISTTKYNVATFLPKFLFEQFSKYANLFFLCTALIQQVPHVSPTNRYTTIGTLMIVLLVSAVKELIEDFKRAAADRELNNSKAMVLNATTQEFDQRRWVDVKVGDIVRVDSELPMPADLVLLSSSEPEGLCYIETSNLDGETNLKIKQSSPATSHLTDSRSLAQMRGRIQSEQPNSSLYTYEGTLELEGQSKVALAPDQLLLRGTSLRNTPWIHGVVIFTGHETKLMRNATATPIKRTAVEHMINLQIIFLFTILIVMAVLSSLGNIIKMHQWRESMWYLQLGSASIASTFFLDLLTYWILFSNLVPISLFVTVEIIKFYQAFLISNDLEMYYEPTDTPAVCRTSSLVEELGQIQYIFSDKTGTLTRNIMEFKACTIGGRIYSKEIPEDKRYSTDDDGNRFYDFEQLRKDLRHPDWTDGIANFFTLLAVCHTVIPEVLENHSIKYQASSPDEGALVDGAAEQGFTFTVRRPNSLTIEVGGREEQYELLNICEFNSTRKRMSAILRCPDNRIRLFCKGADTVIFERLASETEEGEYVRQQTTESLENFASEGLRTLCLAWREISDAEYEEWARKYEEAATSMEDRSEKLDAVAELIETDLELLGATAIEDKLQEGVPETIHLLQDAGIKIWVLTGDRQETAINIGMSCKLLAEDMNLLIVNESDAAGVADNIARKLELIRSSEATNADFETLALVIDGVSLGYALTPEIEQDFLDLSVMCKAVICCRVSPLQKAMVVKLVKRHLKSLLLAIGDGANDVSMIQAAHVGVGISGMEGQQAARSADISIGQFRYLQRLLLVHGSWSYNRLSRAILYSFYKNIALYMTQFWYVFYNGFSGMSIYESWTVTFYNVICTALPPFALGIMDQYVSARLLLRYPQLYTLGQKGAFLNVTAFWQWICNGIYHSIIIFFFSVGAFHWSNTLPDGRIADHWTWGTAAFTACVLTTLGKAALVTNTWTRFTLLAVPGSFLIWLGFFPAYAEIAPKVNVSTEYRGVLRSLYPTAVFWAMTLLIAMACLIRDIAWKYFNRMYRPRAYHYVQEIQSYNIADHQPRMDQFQRAIRKVRQVQRMRKQRGYAFSQADEGIDKVIRTYDTSVSRDQSGQLRTALASVA